MCNLYSLTKGQAAIVALAKALRDHTGNLPPLPGIFPDYAAPIVRNAAPTGCANSRWPAGACRRPPSALNGRTTIPASPISGTPPRRTGAAGLGLSTAASCR